MRLAICICTKDRPETLNRCLDSIASGNALPDFVVVSDDSQETTATRAVCQQYGFVQYQRGPRRGLCANRNAVLHPIKADFVCLLDDDALVSPTFVSRVRALLPSLPPHTIVTGDVLEEAAIVRPQNPSFWGHFKARPVHALKTINLNCNCFPTDAFTVASFSEDLVYGYEDMDLCSCLLSKGYRIQYEPSLINTHDRPEDTKVISPKRTRLVEQARFQTSMRRYLVWERDLPKAVLYFLLAPLHRVVHAVRVRNYLDIPRSGYDMLLASYQALQLRKNLSRTAG